MHKFDVFQRLITTCYRFLMHYIMCVLLLPWHYCSDTSWFWGSFSKRHAPRKHNRFWVTSTTHKPCYSTSYHCSLLPRLPVTRPQHCRAWRTELILATTTTARHHHTHHCTHSLTSLIMAALWNRTDHHNYSAKKLKLRRVLQILCGAFERCSRVRL